jgi:uncharacterized protein YbjT (DUF2867 family)
VLVVGVGDELGRALVARLVVEGDEVRVIEDRPDAVDGWKRLGAHVAPGSPDDPDLVERAAQDARTIVVGDGDEAIVSAAIEGARLAGGGGIRIVVVATMGPTEHVRASGGELIVLRTSASIAATDVAAAVDAADDVEEVPSDELDLTGPTAWRALRLDPPSYLS